MRPLGPIIRPATLGDVRALHAVVERAYRGDSARHGWTHEADLVKGPRTTADVLAAAVTAPDDMLLAAFDGTTVIGCVQITRRTPDIGYLGLLTVDPRRQTAGLGKSLITSAEHAATHHFRVRQLEMTVIARRTELIAYYRRRGYAPTGERRPFPILLDPPLDMIVLEKTLSA